MGMLGDSWDDPKSLATLQLAAGLLGPGGFGTGLSRGLLGYQASLGADTETKLKQQMIEATRQEAALRDLNVRRQLAMLSEAQAWDHPNVGQASAMPSISPATAGLTQGAQELGSVGPTKVNATLMDQIAGQPQQAAAAPQAPPLPPGIAGYQGMPLEQLRSRMNAGLEPKDAPELWKAANFGMPFQPGYRALPNGQVVYNGDPTKGIGMNNGAVTLMPNAANVLGAVAEATKGGEVRGANAQTLVPIERIDRTPGISPFATINDLINPLPSVRSDSPVKQLSPVQQANVAADMRASGNPNATFNGVPITQANPRELIPSITGFKTPADLEAEKLRATQNVRIETDPVLELRKDIPLKAHAANQSFITNLADVTNNEGEIVARNERLQPLLAQLPKVGGFGAEERIDIANKLKQAGVSDALTKKIAGGDPEAAKVVLNQLSAAALQTMIDTLNKEGKPNRTIYQALKEQQEGLAAGKNVLSGVMALQKQLYEQHQKQLGTATDLMSSSEYNPVKFQFQFATQKADQIKNTTPTSLPTNPTSQNLTVGTKYRLPNGKVGEWDGKGFRSE